ncbi:7 transmembrane receptor (rhodopsin family) domain-containing protein [Ditylenchus destructor]|uniref:7 transmembrane receptor (Rhodopsin family) domain-containing protein n=1 Tax=Ditylenchus destructor TaxID=166010 RepID=A0AAD4N0C9_9BILA|nr:7 transmembrane receptor (rhodopsin family) domain-containing protein [Ditylenchus destructor]
MEPVPDDTMYQMTAESSNSPQSYNCNSPEPWRPLGMVLDLWVLPIVCVSGLALNLACLVVFSQRRLYNYYYIASSIASGGLTNPRSPSTSSSTTSTPNGSGRSYSRAISTTHLRPLPRKPPQKLSSVSLLLPNNSNLSRKLGVRRTPSANNTVVVVEKEESFAYTRMNCGSRGRRGRRHPLVPALILLSICDSLQLLFSLFVLYLPALHDHMEMDPYGWVAQIAYLATGTLAGGLLASNCASIWTMCYISIQRHKAIVKPLSTVSAKRSSHLPLCGIGLAAVLFNLPVWFEFNWSVAYVQNPDDPTSSTSILWHSMTLWSQSHTYRFMMHKVLYPIAVYLVPLILISVLNMRILSYIASSARLQSTSVGHQRRLARERRSVWLLISIVLMFFVCHTGGLVIRLFDFSEYGNAPCFVFAKDFVNFMFNINSFANPMLYFFFTKQFKDLRTTWSAKSKISVSNGNHSPRNTSTPKMAKRLLGKLSSRGNGTEREDLT